MKKIAIILMASGFLWAGTIKAQSQQEHTPFDESVWRVEHLQNQKKIIQSYQEEKNFTHFSFNPYTHKITGSGLCNKFLGKFDQAANKVTIHDIVTTHNICLASEVNAQDEIFFNTLKSVTSYSIHGKILRLKDAQNHSLIIARWAR